MDKNLETVEERRIQRVIDALERNNITGYIVKNGEELLAKVRELIPAGSSVGAGGSASIAETGILELVRGADYKFFDRYAARLTPEQIDEVHRQTFLADAYVSSTNAITEDGWLYNVDGNGNRVAALLYGPKKVIVVAGKNKIVRDLNAAIVRNEDISGPANNIRLKLPNPCVTTGKCMNCKSASRICNEYTLIKRQKAAGRMFVIFTTWESAIKARSAKSFLTA